MRFFFCSQTDSKCPENMVGVLVTTIFHTFTYDMLKTLSLGIMTYWKCLYYGVTYYLSPVGKLYLRVLIWGYRKQYI
jgi:hypothetical protein